MTVDKFRSTYPNYKGWLEKVVESNLIKITKPKNGSVFQSKGKRKEKDIVVAGTLGDNKKGKILVIIRSDIDYPQALGKVDKNGNWSFPGCRLGSVDHQIYAVFVNDNDKPLFRSKVVNVRLERGN